MADNKRNVRAGELLKFLLETNKRYTKLELIEHFKWHSTTMNRVLVVAEKTGSLEVDTSRQPFLYRYRKGTTPNFYNPFELTDTPQKEFDIRELLNALTAAVKEDWKVPVTSASANLIYSLLFGLALHEGDDIHRYNEFIDEVITKTRNLYLAHRIALTIKNTQQRERSLKNLGVTWKKDEPFVDMSLLYRDMFNWLIEQLPN